MLGEHEAIAFPVPVLPRPRELGKLYVTALYMRRELWHDGNGGILAGYRCDQCRTLFFGSEWGDLRHLCTEIKIPVGESFAIR